MFNSINLLTTLYDSDKCQINIGFAKIGAQPRRSVRDNEQPILLQQLVLFKATILLSLHDGTDILGAHWAVPRGDGLPLSNHYV